MPKDDAIAPSPPAPRPGRRPSRSREEIVACALRMLDRDGLEALTFRAVARELGMSVGALVRYFKNLADLQDEVGAAILSTLRPLHASNRKTLRNELVRLSLDLIEVQRMHPYLLKIHGPAGAAAIGRLMRECLRVMVDAGIGFEKAVAIFALVGNMPKTWAAPDPPAHGALMQAEIERAYSAELAEFEPQMKKLAGGDGAAITRRWITLYIDALLAD